MLTCNTRNHSDRVATHYTFTWAAGWVYACTECANEHRERMEGAKLFGLGYVLPIVEGETRRETGARLLQEHNDAIDREQAERERKQLAQIGEIVY